MPFVFQLSVEDFSWQDEAGEGAFPNLENISSESDGLTYLPFVHAPLRAFHHHLPMQGQNWHNVKLAPNGLLSDAAMNETLLFVNLDDATSSEDRPGLLKRHGKLFVQPSNLVDELTYLITYLLTSWSRVLLEKPTSSHIVKKFPSIYGTRWFITTFTSAHDLSLS